MHRPSTITDSDMHYVQFVSHFTQHVPLSLLCIGLCNGLFALRVTGGLQQLQILF